jgi:hypothetical protein
LPATGSARAGTTTADASGNGLSGTLVGSPAWVSGKNGIGLSFNGSSTHVDLGNPTALQFTGSMTVSAWSHETANVGDDGQIIAKSDGSSGWQLKSSPDTGVRTFAIAVTDANGNPVQRYSGTVRALNTWYHVTGVFNAAARTLDIYVNGVLDNGVLDGTIPTSIRSGPENVSIGRRAGGYYIKGTIDDVRIYAWRSPRPRSRPTLALRWAAEGRRTPRLRASASPPRRMARPCPARSPSPPLPSTTWQSPAFSSCSIA